MPTSPTTSTARCAARVVALTSCCWPTRGRCSSSTTTPAAATPTCATTVRSRWSPPRTTRPRRRCCGAASRTPSTRASTPRWSTPTPASSGRCASWSRQVCRCGRAVRSSGAAERHRPATCRPAPGFDLPSVTRALPLAPPAVAQVPRQPGEKDQPGSDGDVGRVPRDGLDVVSGEVADRAPEADPGRRTEHVEQHEASPRHLDDAGDDTVELPQTLDEPGDEHDLAAVAGEERLRAVEAIRRDEDDLAVLQDEVSPTGPSDDVADVVTEDGGDESDETDQPDVEVPCAGVQGRRDEHRLAGQRDAEVLEEEEPAHGEVAPVVQPALEVLERPGKRLGRSGEQPVRQRHVARPARPRLTGRARPRPGTTGTGPARSSSRSRWWHAAAARDCCRAAPCRWVRTGTRCRACRGRRARRTGRRR